MRGNALYVAFMNLYQHVVVDNNMYNVTMVGLESVTSNVREVKKMAETGGSESRKLEKDVHIGSVTNEVEVIPPPSPPL